MTEQTYPYIVEIKKNALDDGPGIRTIIFFKGCPLSCVWCQNPETKSSKQELIYEREKCTKCLDCVKVCEFHALDFSKNFPIIQDNCNFCGNCIETCPSNAIRYAGRQYSIDELLHIILKDKVFFQNSGGGVTFSGGEPTLHMTYLHKLLKRLKDEEIHTCLETCGYYNRSQFNEYILPYIDLVYFDLKIFNERNHYHYCNTSNRKILRNFEDLINKNKINTLPRIPLIPNITATTKNLEELASYLKKQDIRKIGLLPYNPLWVSKMATIGKELEYTYSKWLTDKEKSMIKEIFNDFEYRDF
ncbi:MAG: glycyl-radical enzyme activating protein [Promethearchaeota archaeon]|nr:MAG: glycyl-radical enzyme activating protein [Candidatus Lokiarchaeota archaeon]